MKRRTMNRDFEKCLKNRRIVKQDHAGALMGSELETAREDLEETRETLKRSRYKWATIQAYYAMFHAARALVYSKDYREKSHYYLAVALRALFVDEGKMDAQSVRDLLNAMNLREAADYDAEFSQSGAKAVIESADKFIQKAIEILGII